MLSIEPNDISTVQLHSYLLSAVAPRPIALASTISSSGKPNVSPFSFFNVFSAKPPILIFSPARRVRNNTIKHTLENVEEVSQVVINVVNHAIVQQMSLTSTEYAKDVNEFEKAGFTMLKSDLVAPFRVAESPVQFECKVNEIVQLGNEGGAGNLVICEVLKVHIDEAVLAKDNSIDQHKLDVVARAGGSYYSRANMGFFEIPKPLATLGIGVDALPKEIKESSTLTGNNLGMLANVEQMPNQQDVDNFAKDNTQYIGLETTEKHKFAQEYLATNDVESAWKVLLMK